MAGGRGPADPLVLLLRPCRRRRPYCDPPAASNRPAPATPRSPGRGVAGACPDGPTASQKPAALWARQSTHFRSHRYWCRSA